MSLMPLDPKTAGVVNGTAGNTDPNQVLAELLAQLGQGSSAGGVPRVRPTGSTYERIAGPPQDFGGFGHGPFTFMPGPMNAQNPGLGVLGEMIQSGKFQDILGTILKKKGGAGMWGGPDSGAGFGGMA